MAAIRASAEVLDDRALAEPEEAERFVKRTREATRRIEAILSELLSLARIESRGIENQEPVDMSAVIRSCVEANASRGMVDFGEGPGQHRVRGDRRWLARAVDNLVNNALTHGDGSRPPRVSVATEEGNVEVTVSNHGVVPPHIRKRLFRRFVTSRGDKGGTGLGLPIVRAVTEAHRGKVDVSFDDGEVRFRLRLPRA